MLGGKMTAKTLIRAFRLPLMGAALLMSSFLLTAGSKPPLTQEMMDQATAYMEWILDARFTPVQDREYKESLAAIWRGADQEAIDGVVSMTNAYPQLLRLTPEQQSQVKEKLQGQFLAMLRQSREDQAARWLLGIYESAHRASVGGSGAYLGRWSTGRISTIQYENRVTGAPAPTSGNRFAYEFKEDGTYEFTGLMQNTVYHCTNLVFSRETGTYTVEGDTLSLRPQRNPYKMTNNCAPSSNKESEGKLVARSFRFRVVAEDGRQRLDLTNVADGSVSSFRSDL